MKGRVYIWGDPKSGTLIRGSWDDAVRSNPKLPSISPLELFICLHLEPFRLVCAQEEIAFVFFPSSFICKKLFFRLFSFFDWLSSLIFLRREAPVITQWVSGGQRPYILPFPLSLFLSAPLRDLKKFPKARRHAAHSSTTGLWSLQGIRSFRCIP